MSKESPLEVTRQFSYVPIASVLLNVAAGATWVSAHHGGGVSIGYSIHAGMVVVADGTKRAEKRLLRVLTTDPGTGVMRHTDAGYEETIEAAKKSGIKIPGVTIYHTKDKE